MINLPKLQGCAAVTLAEEVRPRDDMLMFITGASASNPPLSTLPRYWESKGTLDEIWSFHYCHITTTHQTTVVAFEQQGAACDALSGQCACRIKMTSVDRGAMVAIMG
jgi:hypothetical protein